MTAARSAHGGRAHEPLRYRPATPPPGARSTGAVRTSCRSSTSFGKIESRGQALAAQGGIGVPTIPRRLEWSTVMVHSVPARPPWLDKKALRGKGF
jgi:hypothetical protein